jgi:predicted MFS family arabinose efflux permease
LGTGPAVWILAAAGTVSWGLLYYSFGVLLRPMAEALHVSEAEIAGAFSVALLAAAVAAPVVGRAVDRVGAGPVLAAGSGIGALGFALASRVESTPWLYAAWGLLGAAHACTSYEPAFAAVTAWLPDLDARRRALLVVTSLGGLASPIFVPFAALVVEAAGFRSGALLFAAVLLFVVTPLHATLATVRHPASPPSPRSGAPASGPTLLAAVLALQAFASTSLAAFVFPALQDRDVTPAEAAALAGLVGAAQVPARLLYGPLCRQVPAHARLATLLAAQAVALVAFGSLSGPSLALALLAFGAANGLVTLERASVVADWFGLDGYGARSGSLAAGSMAARAAAPLVMALMARHASYDSAFLVVACGLGVAIVLQLAGERRRAGSRAVPG